MTFNYILRYIQYTKMIVAGHGDNHLRAGRANPVKRFARNGHSEQIEGVVKPIIVESVCDNVSL